MDEEVQDLRELKMPNKLCQDKVVANYQEEGWLKEVKKRGKFSMKEGGWRRK